MSSLSISRVWCYDGAMLEVCVLPRCRGLLREVCEGEAGADALDPQPTAVYLWGAAFAGIHIPERRQVRALAHPSCRAAKRGDAYCPVPGRVPLRQVHLLIT